MYVFGSGVLIGTPSGGSPINFGLAQEVTLNIATTTKALYGQNNFPVAIGSGTRKMTGKAKLARISGQALGSLFFGVTANRRRRADAVRRDGVRAGDRRRSPIRRRFHSDLHRRPGRRLRGDRPAAEGCGLGAGARASIRSRPASTRSAPRTPAPRCSFPTPTRCAGAGESVAVVSQLIGPSITFSANLFAADPTTGKQFSLFLYNCVAEKLVVRHQARGLHDAGARFPVLRQCLRPGLPAQLRRRGVTEDEFVVELAGTALGAAASAVPRHQS